MAIIINGQGRVGVRVAAPSGGGGASYLLDTYGGAAAAYSLRKLSSTYSGSAIRVRRSSDNTEQNIGFDGSGNLDEAALTSFVGAGNGFVTTWYDQSGSGRNAIQTTAANQPQIVSSGSVIKTNNKPTLRFDGVNDSLSLGNQTVGISTMVQVIKRNGNATGTYHPIFTCTSGPRYFQHYVPNSTNVSNLYFGSNLTTGQSFDTTLQCFQTYFDSTVSQYKNNVIGTTTSATITSENTGEFNLGKWLETYLNADYSEFIWYNNSQLSNQNGISTNINTYYSIY